MKNILTLAALAAAASAAPAFAQTAPVSGDVVRIPYADLDLRSGSGRAAFDRRIAEAVRFACGDISTADPRGANDVYRCRAELGEQLGQRRDAVLARLGSSGSELARR